MKWNWQRADWPNFRYDSKALEEYERQFLYESGILEGVKKHANKDLSDFYMTQILVDEAMSTSAIEGEFLDRESVKSSLRKVLGLKVDNKKALPKELGIARIMMTMLANHGRLCHGTLIELYNELMQKPFDPELLHPYRTGEEPMQVISYGKWHEPIVHFEAPPHHIVYEEMDRFITWFNNEPP